MPDNITRFAMLNMYHVALFAYFLDKLRSTPDGDGTLLDHSLVLYGSGLSDGNQHNHTDLPILLAGGASGRLKGGRHLRHPEEHADGEPARRDARQARGHDGQAWRQHRADQPLGLGIRDQGSEPSLTWINRSTRLLCAAGSETPAS